MGDILDQNAATFGPPLNLQSSREIAKVLLQRVSPNVPHVTVGRARTIVAIGTLPP